MRRVYPLVAMATVVTMVGIFAGGGLSSLARQEDAPPPRLLPSPAFPSPFQYQGVASCTAAACHHGNGPPGTRGSEYTTWISRNDPHARAYRVLFDPRSLTIQKNMGSPRKPHEDVLCLRCHVNPDVETASHAERFSRTDGVGCESCHGAAEKWLTVHYKEGWKTLTPEQKERQGMTNTKDVVVRARTCVNCHVGLEEADVNHDLIAAGHPRLRFEYGAYLANYPARHWKRADDHQRYCDFEARAWLVGQTVSAKAALDLLVYRADPDHHKPWPEFAEYGCFSCHHELRDQEWRRKPGAGKLAWGTWYFAQRSIVAEALRSPRGDAETFDKLADVMAANYPDSTQVRKHAGEAARVLDRWTAVLGEECRDKETLELLLASLGRNDPQAEGRDWERAAQRYLGIAAIYNALGDVNDGYKQDANLKNVLHDLANRLSDAYPTDPCVKYDSPRNFEPNLLHGDLQRLREQLHQHGVD